MQWKQGNLDYFSDGKGLRGFVSWTRVLDSGAVNVCTGAAGTVAKTVAHELMHVAQRLRLGSPEEPKGLLLNELEREADDYAEKIYAPIWAARSADRHRE